MNKLQALNTWMTPKMPLLILGALALGLLFPDQIGLLCPAVSALMMFQTFANSLGSSVQDLGRVLSHPKPVLITMLSLHLLMPLAALGIGSMCFPDQPLYTLSLVLMEGSPAAVSSLMWIVIGGGSVELCLSIILLDTMLSPVILPLTLRLLCGSVVELDTFGMIRDLFVMIVVPAALAMVLCRLLTEHDLTERHARALLRLEDEEERLNALHHIIRQHLNVAQTEQYIDKRLAQLQTTPPSGRRVFLLKDVRLFLNSLDRGLRLVREAGIGAESRREDTEDAILLTIRIPKNRRIG